LNCQLDDAQCVVVVLLLQLFERPMLEAQRELGVGLTRFKEVCREFGITRWPERSAAAAAAAVYSKTVGSILIRAARQPIL
jgi:hypothetical protein